MNPAARTQAALAIAVAFGVAAVTGLHSVGTTSAAYTDSADASLETYTLPAAYETQSSMFDATSMALSDGYVWMWGYKSTGMNGLGINGTAAGSAPQNPQPVYSLPNVVKAVGGSDLSETPGTVAALTTDGEVYTWGTNKLGRLGVGRTESQLAYASTPQKVTIPNGEKVIDIGSMRATLAALTADGNVYTWGSGQYGQAGNGSTTESAGPRAPYLVISDVHSMHVGQRLVRVVKRDNTVWWWGRSFEGEAGNLTDSTTNLATPTRLPAISALATGCEGPAVPVYDESDTCSIVAMPTSRQASAVLMRDGTIYTFGNDDEGQLGRPYTTADRVQIKPIALISEHVTHVDAGNYHFLALTENGTVWAWGDNGQWQATGNIRADGSTGQGQTDADRPIKLPLTNIVKIGGSRETSYATRSDSVLVGWGDGRLGAIWGGNEVARMTFTPLVLPGVRAAS